MADAPRHPRTGSALRAGLILAAALSLGAVAAGCGDSDNGSGAAAKPVARNARPATGICEPPPGRIAFRRYLDDPHTRGAIFHRAQDGTDERQLTHPRPGRVQRLDIEQTDLGEQFTKSRREPQTLVVRLSTAFDEPFVDRTATALLTEEDQRRDHGDELELDEFMLGWKRRWQLTPGEPLQWHVNHLIMGKWSVRCEREEEISVEEIVEMMRKQAGQDGVHGTGAVQHGFHPGLAQAADSLEERYLTENDDTDARPAVGVRPALVQRRALTSSDCGAARRG